MSGIDENGNPIYYPGENQTKWQRIWNGSPIHGGGLSSMIGTVLMFAGCTLFLYSISMFVDKADNTKSSEPVNIEQTQ